MHPGVVVNCEMADLLSVFVITSPHWREYVLLEPAPRHVSHSKPTDVGAVYLDFSRNELTPLLTYFNCQYVLFMYVPIITRKKSFIEPIPASSPRNQCLRCPTVTKFQPAIIFLSVAIYRRQEAAILSETFCPDLLQSSWWLCWNLQRLQLAKKRHIFAADFFWSTSLLKSDVQLDWWWLRKS